MTKSRKDLVIEISPQILGELLESAGVFQE
jgi:hypothetical protein